MKVSTSDPTGNNHSIQKADEISDNDTDSLVSDSYIMPGCYVLDINKDRSPWSHARIRHGGKVPRGLTHVYNTPCYKHPSFKHGFKLCLTMEDARIIIHVNKPDTKRVQNSSYLAN
jgi:hypothetical protein